MKTIDMVSDEKKTSDDYQRLKAALHRFVIDRIEDDEVLYEGNNRKLAAAVSAYIRQYCRIYEVDIEESALPLLERELLDEITGYGPLQSLLDDPSINDILINGPKSIFIERNGILEKTNLRFIDDRHVLRVIRRMISPLGRRIDESSPLVDGRLPDGSRINAIVPPLSLEGPCLSIRKFRKDPLTDAELIRNGAISEEALNFLKRCVEQRKNIMISGATGSGKTTLLNALSQYIDPSQRLVTIEDAAELQLRHDHVVRLETRPPNNEGVGEITARDLVKNSLRMRPDRIIVGESRGPEVLDMLQAMNTGHSGSMSTVHANSARDALTRLEVMVGMSGFQGSVDLIQRMIGSALDMVVHVGRLSDGTRVVAEICDVSRDVPLSLRAIYEYDQQSRILKSLDPKNNVYSDKPVSEMI